MKYLWRNWGIAVLRHQDIEYLRYWDINILLYYYYYLFNYRGFKNKIHSPLCYIIIYIYIVVLRFWDTEILKYWDQLVDLHTTFAEHRSNTEHISRVFIEIQHKHKVRCSKIGRCSIKVLCKSKICSDCSNWRSFFQAKFGINEFFKLILIFARYFFDIFYVLTVGRSQNKLSTGLFYANKHIF